MGVKGADSVAQNNQELIASLNEAFDGFKGMKGSKGFMVHN